MYICIQYRNKETSKVEDRYWDSQCLRHTAHQQLLDSLQESSKDFDMTKIVRLSTDGPNVNLTLLKVMKNQRKELPVPAFIDFGSCNLYTVNGKWMEVEIDIKVML